MRATKTRKTGAKDRRRYDRSMALSDSFFGQKFGITENDLQNYLSEALGAGGDYADLYFEYLTTSSISIDESMIKSAVQGVSLGVGVRVIWGAMVTKSPRIIPSSRQRQPRLRP